MATVRTLLVILTICATYNIRLTRSTEVLHRITDFVKNEAEYVHEKIKDAAHAVHDLFHHHHKPHPYPPVVPETFPHISSEAQPLDPKKQETPFPPYITGEQTEASNNPYNPPVEDNSIFNPAPATVSNELPTRNNVPNVTYDIDIRNSETGMIGSSTQFPPTTSAVSRALFSFSGCPEGQRKDRAGKCRSIN